MSTKIHTLVDALGNPVGFHLTGGEAHDLVGADALLPDMRANMLLADKAFDAAGTTILVPNVMDAPAPEAAAQVIVDASDGTVLLAAADGTVVAQFPASTGSEHDPLPLGEWKVTVIAVDPTFSYNPDLFWDADPEHAKAKLAAGPNNPVGRVWIELSKEHYGIHGTPEPSRVGKSESHGCIRVTNWTAVLLSAVVKSGMPVLMRE